LDKDSVYSLLYILWVLDESVYADERQRVQDSTAILMSTFFGCRLASIFDTRVKLNPRDPNDEEEHTESAPSPVPTRSGTGTSSNLKSANDDEGITDDTSSSDNDDCKDIDDEEGYITDDDSLAGNDQTRTFLYRHISIFIVSQTVGEPSSVFMKITQPNTKGQDRNPRV
jgi:hypothetical protein